MISYWINYYYLLEYCVHVSISIILVPITYNKIFRKRAYVLPVYFSTVAYNN